ncbi:MAG: aminotransferase class IV [Proteobacteria bacterium]|nr:aminotransferase class IV [Pseudomonadota bacterium]
MKDKLPLLTPDMALARVKDRAAPWGSGYYAMYSSVWGGIVTEPWLMMVPADDHVVHRGDGVFESAKCVDGVVYRFEAHLDRLKHSAGSIWLELPLGREGLRQIVAAVIRAGGRRTCSLRIIVSRGPGGFTANPFECAGPEVYVIAYRLKTPSPESYTRGIKVATTRVPIKPGAFANIKSCNYLPNVLVKREATLQGAHYGLTVDEEGMLAEGATESLGLVTPDGRLMLPPGDRVLPGITAARVKDLAPRLVGGLLSAVEVAKFGPADALEAREVLLFGTSIDVLPITRIDGQTVADGRPGPVSRALLELIRADMVPGSPSITPVW